jgi:hypothetical protein
MIFVSFFLSANCLVSQYWTATGGLYDIRAHVHRTGRAVVYTAAAAWTCEEPAAFAYSHS